MGVILTTSDTGDTANEARPRQVTEADNANGDDEDQAVVDDGDESYEVISNRRDYAPNNRHTL
jgi:hypothetical protein